VIIIGNKINRRSLIRRNLWKWHNGQVRIVRIENTKVCGSRLSSCKCIHGTSVATRGTKDSPQSNSEYNAQRCASRHYSLLVAPVCIGYPTKIQVYFLTTEEILIQTCHGQVQDEPDPRHLQRPRAISTFCCLNRQKHARTRSKTNILVVKRKERISIRNEDVRTQL
jgi:hypothetical protein